MHTRVLIAALLMALAAPGCTHFERVEVRPRVGSFRFDTSSLRVGDTVRIVRFDRERLDFVLTAFDERALEGPGVRVPTEEIQSVAVLRRGLRLPGRFWRAGGGVGGALAGALLGALILIAVL